MCQEAQRHTVQDVDTSMHLSSSLKKLNFFAESVTVSDTKTFCKSYHSLLLKSSCEHSILPKITFRLLILHALLALCSKKATFQKLAKDDLF